MTTITSTTTLTQKHRYNIPNASTSSSPSSTVLPSTLSSSTATATAAVSSAASSRLRLAIDGHWYDLTHWQHTHPGGPEILNHLNNQDATDAFYSLHSNDAIQRLKRMQKTSLCTAVKQGELPSPTAATIAFRQLRTELISEGWFQRSFFRECFYHGHVYLLAFLGSYAAYYHYNIIAILCIAIAMQQAGWIGHDSVHGRGSSQHYLGRTMSGLINAFSPTWWSHKHNTHHVYTNHIGIDVDIENEPVFHLFTPYIDQDVWYRRYQHLYFIPVAAFLYISWRIQSLQHVIKTNNIYEMIPILINLIWLIWLGLPIALPSIYIAGGLVALIVTATHQSEEMIINNTPTISQPYSFVECQFLTTRDARCGDIIMEWLWGGMQYQLEHHLFPTMPKYYYASLAKRIEIWAQQHQLEYRADNVWQIWQRNFHTLAFWAKQPPQTPTEPTIQGHNPFHLLASATM